MTNCLWGGRPSSLVLAVIGISLTAAASAIAQSSPAPPSQSSDSGRAGGYPPTYFEFQIEKPAHRMANSENPVRPAGATQEGFVFAQFVVDTSGTPLRSTFHVLRQTSPAHGAAVFAALPRIRYFPAEIGGKRVFQLVQEKFVF